MVLAPSEPPKKLACHPFAVGALLLRFTPAVAVVEAPPPMTVPVVQVAVTEATAPVEAGPAAVAVTRVNVLGTPWGPCAP